MKFKEIEYKYNADKIDLNAFKVLCASFNERHEYNEASGYDHFYSPGPNSDSFGRHRIGADINQLTTKHKTSTKHNYFRDEINTKLDKSETKENVCAQFKSFGYEYVGSLFKNCFVFNFETFTAVYYAVYDDKLTEHGRYLEIELSEDVDWITERRAYDALNQLEEQFSKLGITPQHRIKKSLYELFIKE